MQELLPIGTIVQIISKEEFDSFPKDNLGGAIMSDYIADVFDREKLPACDCKARIISSDANNPSMYLYDLRPLYSDNDADRVCSQFLFSSNEFHIIKLPDAVTAPVMSFESLMKGECLL